MTVENHEKAHTAWGRHVRKSAKGFRIVAPSLDRLRSVSRNLISTLSQARQGIGPAVPTLCCDGHLTLSRQGASAAIVA